MRIIASTSILSAVCGSAVQSSSNEESASLQTKLVTQQVEASYTSIHGHKGERFLGQECKQTTDVEPDVGILGCRNPKATCEHDELSNLGGRCTMDRSTLTRKTIEQPIFSHRQQGPHFLTPQQRSESDIPRFLQNDSWSCPSNCPRDFCRCAKKFGEVKHCTKEMDKLCLNGIVSECVPNDFLPFYYQTYCPFSECVVAKNAYQDCSCQYYRDYCTLYYAFNESTEKCGIATCCEAADSVESKIECLPGMQPTIAPSFSPTISRAPSDSPSVSSVPSISAAPTTSPKRKYVLRCMIDSNMKNPRVHVCIPDQCFI